MAYTPSLADLPPASKDEQQYHPSLADISGTQAATQPSGTSTNPLPILEGFLPGGLLQKALSGLTPKSLGIGLASGLESVAEPTRRLEQGALNKINQGLRTNLNLLPTSQILSNQQEQTPAAQVGRFVGPMVASAPFFGLGGIAEGALARVMPRLAARGILSPIEGAGIGAFFDPNAKRGAETGAWMGPATEFGARAAFRGVPAAFKKGVDNLILRHLRRAIKNGNALRPEEAARKVAAQHMNPDGSFAPMNIADVSENKALQTVDKGLQYVPLSGAKSTWENPYDIESYGRRYLDNLAPGFTNRPQLENNLAAEIKKQGKAQRTEGNRLYSPINAVSDNTLEELAQPNTIESIYPALAIKLPKYQSAARNLLDHRDELENIFGEDSDLNSSLRHEINKADYLIKGNLGDATVGNILERIRKSGELASALYKRGHDNAARLLYQLNNGLSSDLFNLLKNSKQPELANQLQIANAHWEKNVIPYRVNRTFRQVMSGKVPKNDKLAQELFDPNNKEVWSHTPDTLKNAALKLLFTKGKGTSQGLTNLTAKGMANAYENSLKGSTKHLINEFNPEANQVFERISAQQKRMPKPEKETKKGAKEKLIPALQAGAAAGAAYLHPWSLLAAGGIPYSRMIAQRLRSPELMARYLRGDTGEIAQGSPIPGLVARGFVGSRAAQQGQR